MNKDGSISVLLDVLPIAGKLHVRNPPPVEQRAAPANGATETTTPQLQSNAEDQNGTPADGRASHNQLERPPMLEAVEGHG